MLTRHAFIVTMALTIAILLTDKIEAAKFTPLGVLGPGYGSQSRAFAVSADGKTVVGARSGSKGSEAIAWTEAEGMVSLGQLPRGDNLSVALGVSADGSTVVGHGSTAFDIPLFGTFQNAFTWNAHDGMVALTRVGETAAGIGFYSTARDVTADGLLSVGRSGPLGGGQAVIWDSENGFLILGDLPGGSASSEARGISADGSRVVGVGNSDKGNEAFIWDADNGMVGLGNFAGSRRFRSQAFGISADGSTVVGFGESERGQEAFRWTEEVGMIGLGDFTEGRFSSTAFAVSADGSIVVGEGKTIFGEVAFVWREDLGMMNIQGLLETQGIDMSEWTLSTASGISDDGHTIVGYGINHATGQTEAWIAELEIVPEPSAMALLLGFTTAFLVQTRPLRYAVR